MKAMVLAAGIGSRLRPLTDRIPKALVPIGGTPLIEIVLRRLAAAGVRDVVVNTHHRAEQLEAYLRARPQHDLRIALSHEPELLDTGGGLKNAAWFFDDGRPFFLHNADVLSAVDLRRLYAARETTGALAVLSVRARESSRRFLFDAGGGLAGWERTDTGERDWAKAPVADATPLAFDGIQVLAPEILAKLSESGCFSLTRAYLRLAGAGERILAHRADGEYWADIGSQAKYEAAERHVATHGLPG
jgi:NDP-sugar pyrophosphorylase family protein